MKEETEKPSRKIFKSKLVFAGREKINKIGKSLEKLTKKRRKSTVS